MDILVNNERVKLAASLLNTGASTCFTVGIATPLAAVFYNLGGLGTALSVTTLLLGIGLWSMATMTLHFLANRLLGRLR